VGDFASTCQGGIAMTTFTAQAAADDWEIGGIKGDYLVSPISDDLYEICLKAGRNTRIVGYATSERMVVDKIREFDLD
jgi:hypothetical protein